MRRALSFALRLAVTAGAVTIAVRAVDVRTLLPLLAHLEWLPLLVAFALLHASQLAGSQRTRYYLAQAGTSLSTLAALTLHYVGGMFNALLPGGAGGDVYKAWWVQKTSGCRLGSSVMLMIAGRINGLWVQGLFLCLLAAFSPTLRSLAPEGTLALFCGFVALAGTLAYHLLARRVFRDPLTRQYRAARYSLAIQILQAVCALAILEAMPVAAPSFDMVFLFVLSCLLAMLPVSIGGIGVRELVLLKGSALAGYDAQSGVALALIFSGLNLTVALIGGLLYWRFHPKPQEVAA